MGQRFDYNIYFDFKSGSYNKSWHKIVNNVVESLPQIANDINNLTELPSNPEYSSYYENGTELENRYLWFALPIGNWNLIIDLWLDYYTQNETQIVDTQELVGQNFSFSDSTFFNLTSLTSIIYCKSNGVLHTFQEIHSNDLSNSNFTIALMIPTGGISTIYVAIGVGGAAAIMIVLFIVDRYGNRNMPLETT